MATAGGAATTPYDSHFGTLAVGKAADLVLLDWDKLAYPYLDPETSVLDAVIQRAKSDGVDLVMVEDEAIYQGGRFTRVDRDAALRELHNSLQHALAEDESERRALSKALLPHVAAFLRRLFRPRSPPTLLSPELAYLRRRTTCGGLMPIRLRRPAKALAFR